MLQTSISMLSAPSRQTFLQFLSGIYPSGIYKGGLVTPGAGRVLAIAPFTAMSSQGLNSYSFSGETISLPSPGAVGRVSYLLVLYVKAWTPTSLIPDHAIEFRLVQESLWSSYGDADFCIIFSRIWVDSSSVQISISGTDIDMSIGQFIDLNYTYGKTVLSGTASFNGQTGTQIYHGLGTNDYRVAITPSSILANGIGLGDIWVEKSSDGLNFYVYCTGNVTATFDWVITTAGSSGVLGGGTPSITQLPIGNSNIQTYCVSTNSTAAGQVLATIPQATYRSAEFLIQGSNSTSNVYDLTKILAIHNGSTNVSKNIVGQAFIGETVTGGFSVTADGTNLYLIVTPSSANATMFKIIATLTKI